MSDIKIERLIGFQHVGESDQIEYKPKIEYEIGPNRPIEFSYDVDVTVTDVDDPVQPRQSLIEETKSILDSIFSATKLQIENAIKDSPAVKINASNLAIDMHGLPSEITVEQYIDSSLRENRTLTDQSIIDLFEEACASVNGSARLESLIESIDDFKDLILMKEFFDAILEFILPGENKTLTEKYNDIKSYIRIGEAKLSTLSFEALGLKSGDDRLVEINELIDSIQTVNEINRNKLNIVTNISYLIEGKHLDSQLLISESSVLETTTSDDYFGEDLVDEIFNMIGNTDNLKTRLARLLTTLRINYERDKDSILNQRKTYTNSNPKYALKQVLNNISIYSKISIEICSQLLYNNKEVNNPNSYLRNLLLKEIENVNKDLRVNLEQLYYYIKSLHSYRNDVMLAVNAKNKKRMLYKVVEDLSKKSDSIADPETLRLEIQSSITKLNEEN